MTLRPHHFAKTAQSGRTQPIYQVQLALDTTPHSTLVVESLHRFVRADHSSCDLAYVLPPITPHHGRFSALEEEMQVETERIVNQQFDVYTQRLAQNHLAVNQRYFVQTDKPLEEGILDQLEQTTPDLLVIGMHARTMGHGGRHIGSTSYSVATHAPCPVLVVKRPPHQATKLKVLVATDGSSYALNAAQQLTAFLPQENVEISLLNVISVNVYSMPVVEPFVDYTPLEKALQGAAQQVLTNTAQIFTDAGYTVSNQLFLLGDPVDQILTEAEKQQADLIVVGSHGTGDKLRKWLLGSVSAKVLEYSPASVAILK